MYIIKASRRIAVSLILNKTSDLLLSPKTTLPTLLTATGAPSYLASILVPIREAGALLPQAIYAKLLQHNKNRHMPWRLGILLQLLSSIMMLVAGFYLQGLLAGILIVVFLTIWSLSRALCSLTNKDIQGKHLKQGDRGKLIGSASSISASITMVVAVLSLFNVSSDFFSADWLSIIVPPQLNSPKLLVLGGLAIIAQVICIRVMWPLETIVEVKQDKASTDDSKVNIFEFNESLKRFIVMRSLFAHSALIAPLFPLAYQGDLVSVLGYLIVSQAAASLLSAYIWGALSDKSALLCMQLGAVLALFASVILIVLAFQYTQMLTDIKWIVALFFLLSLGHMGVRTGRKIYSLDIAEEHERTSFVAKSNSAVGTFIIIAGTAYSALMAYSINLTLTLMSLGLVCGIVISFSVEKEK